LPQKQSLETTIKALFQTLGSKEPPSSLKDLTLVSAMNTSHIGRAPWSLLATTGPMNSVNYHRLCQLQYTGFYTTWLNPRSDSSAPLTRTHVGPKLKLLFSGP
jgi:hypothetical protein